MARRNRESGDSATPEAPANAAAESTKEAAVTTASEAPAPDAEATPEAAEAAVNTKTAKASEIDLTAFSAAVDTAVAQRDESTGEVAVAIIEPVVAEYRKIEGIAGKNKAKSLLTDKMKEAMNNLNISLARSYMVLQDNLSAGQPTKTEKVPADPTEAHVQRVVGLDLARALLVKPEGVADDADVRAEKLYSEVFPQAQSYLAWSSNEDEATRGDEPEAPAFVKNAVKLALGKAAKVGGSRVSGGGTGERHDIGAHIRQAFENVASGTFLTVAQIRNNRSTEYGDNPPSAGAISARLFPNSGKCTLDFVTPGQNSDGLRGATKK